MLTFVLAASAVVLLMAALAVGDDVARRGEMFDGLMAAFAAMVAVPVLAVAAVCAISLRLMRTRPGVEPVVTLALGCTLTLVSVAGVIVVGLGVSTPLLVLAAALTASAAPEAWPGRRTAASRDGDYRPPRSTR